MARTSSTACLSLSVGTGQGRQASFFVVVGHRGAISGSRVGGTGVTGPSIVVGAGSSVVGTGVGVVMGGWSVWT